MAGVPPPGHRIRAGPLPADALAGRRAAQEATRIAPTSVLALMAWEAKALTGTLTVAARTRPTRRDRIRSMPVTYPGRRPYSSKRPPRYRARKRSAAA